MISSDRIEGARQAALSRPQISVEGAVLDRFGDVVRADLLLRVEIGDGPRDFQYPVISARAEIQLRHGHFHHAFRIRAELAERLDLARAHARVRASLPFAAETLALNFPHTSHPRADGGGRFGRLVARHFAILHRGHFDVDVDAIEQRAGDAVAVALHLHGRAAAIALRIAEVSARAWMRCHFAR